MKRHIESLIISIIFIIVGISITVYEALQYTVVGYIDSNISSERLTYNYNINDRNIEIRTDFTKYPELKYDNNLDPGDVKIEIDYFDSLMVINMNTFIENNKDIIKIEALSKESYDVIKEYITTMINGLKKKKIYNYERALRPNVIISINEVDKDKITIRK